MENPSSISKVLLVFYLLLASGNINNLYSGQLNLYLEENRYAQHIIGLITMMVLVISIGNYRDTSKIIVMSILGYLWFLMTTKLDIEWNVAIIIILAFGYLYEQKVSGEINDIISDFVLDDSEKSKLKEKRMNMIYLFGALLFCLTCVGTYSYYDRKKTQYMDEFDGIKFILMPGRKSMNRHRLTF